MSVGIFWLAFSLSFTVAAKADLNPDIAARIAAINNESDGTHVTEALMRRGDFPGTATQEKLMQAATAITPYLDLSVREAPWNQETRMGLDGPACFDAAPKLGLILRATGLPGWVAVCAHHVFLVAETREATLLIDPTIRQYFGQESAPDWVPKIFVGTLTELRELYEREPGLPNLPYQRIYFDPDWPAYRSDSRMLGRRDSFLSYTMSNEHAPLTAYFNKFAPIFRCEKSSVREDRVR